MLAKSILVAYSSLLQSQVQLAFREHCNFLFIYFFCTQMRTSVLVFSLLVSFLLLTVDIFGSFWLSLKALGLERLRKGKQLIHIEIKNKGSIDLFT